MKNISYLKAYFMQKSIFKIYINLPSESTPLLLYLCALCSNSSVPQVSAMSSWSGIVSTRRQIDSITVKSASSGPKTNACTLDTLHHLIFLHMVEYQKVKSCINDTF